MPSSNTRNPPHQKNKQKLPQTLKCKLWPTAAKTAYKQNVLHYLRLKMNYLPGKTVKLKNAETNPKIYYNAKLTENWKWQSRLKRDSAHAKERQL